MVPRVTANSLQMNQILKGSNSTHLTMQRKLDLGNIICSMCQQTSCALYCFTHYVACHCSVFLIFFSCIVAILLHLSSFFKCKMPIFHFFSCQYVHSPHLAVNFYLSWWSTSTPPGSHPSPLLAVNLPTSWWSASTSPGGQPPPLQAVNLHHPWRSISTPPGGQPPSLRAVNLRPSCRSTSTPPGGQPSPRPPVEGDMDRRGET